MSTRLIVKNVPAAADEKRLRAHFGDQGDITDVKVQRKKCAPSLSITRTAESVDSRSYCRTCDAL